MDRIFRLWNAKDKQVIEVQAIKRGDDCWMALCPNHPDHNPSLSISEKVKLYHCFSCGWSGKLFEGDSIQQSKKILACYRYEDEDGKLLYEILRYEGKRFRVRRRGYSGKWIYNLNGITPVLYKLPQLIKSSEKIFIVEGEKDVDNLITLGFIATTNPFGTGKWRDEYCEYLRGREVIVLPDNDTAGLTHAILVAKSLEGKAKSVRILNPKVLGLEEKGDISDWIAKGGTKEKLLEVLSDQRSFLNWEQKEKELYDKKVEEILQRGDSEFEKEPLTAQNFQNGILSYGAIWDGVKILVKSDGTILEAPEAKFSISKLRSKTVRRFLNKEIVNGDRLVTELRRLIRKHIFFKDERIPTLIAVWILGSYFFEVFDFYGYLWVTSPAIRCGKSLLLDTISQLAFNSTPRLVNPSVASIYRSIAFNKSTIILDEVEKLRNEDREEFSALMAILNGGFQKSSTVPRVEKNREGFTTIDFPVYSPKILAGINQISDSIKDRSFRIAMVRKTQDEKTVRFNLRKEKEQIQNLKESSYMFALRYAQDIGEIYEGIGEIQEIESLNDRQKDIMEPVLSVALLIDEACNSTLYNELVSLACDMSQRDKERNLFDEAIPIFASLIDEILPNNKDQVFISTNELFQRIQDEGNLQFIKSKKGLATFIQKLTPDAPAPTMIRNGSSVVRGYYFERRWIDELLVRYA
jgi:hypothetical protein